MAKTVRKRRPSKRPAKQSAPKVRLKTKKAVRLAIVSPPFPTLPSDFKPTTGRGARALKAALPTLPKGFAPKPGRGAAARRAPKK